MNRQKFVLDRFMARVSGTRKTAIITVHLISMLLVIDANLDSEGLCYLSRKVIASSDYSYKEKKVIKNFINSNLTSVTYMWTAGKVAPRKKWLRKEIKKQLKLI